ncbi:MAG: DUF58 domain-containing protein [Flavobacteriales bacterium]|nr:MAG: DUF58 domain-containing protein [Flavobacteriales bacterium]
MKRLWRSFFITRRGFIIGWLLVGLFVAGWFSAPLFGLARALGLGLLIAMGLELLVLYRARNGIVGERHTYAKWSNGDENPVTIHLRSRYGVPVRVRVLDELPVQFQRRDLVFSGTLAAGGELRFPYAVRPVKRGVYGYGAINVLTSVLIGLVERRFVLEAGKEVAVYPSFLQLRKYELLAISDKLTMAGIKRIRRLAQHVEFDRIKEYVPGDDRRTVNWKATARRGRLMVNLYQDERSQQVFSLIDLGRVMKMPFEGLSLLDYAINASLVISNIAMHKEDKAGLITFSNKVDTVLRASRQRGQMEKILEQLYAQRTDHMETDMEALYATVKVNITQRSLLLLFTNYESVNALRRQLTFLQRLSRTHLLVVIFFQNTELEDDLKARPTNTVELYSHTITEKHLYEKRLIVKELEGHGIASILTRPQDLTVNVVNKYLEIKARGAL